MKGWQALRRSIPMVLAWSLVGGATAARGQQVAVLSASSADGLIAGVRGVVAATGSEDAQFKAVLGLLDGLKQPGRLKGLDRGKPFGAYVMFQGLNRGDEPPYAVLLVPVADQGDFLTTLAQAGVPVAPIKKAEAPKVTHQVNLPGAGARPFLGYFEDGYAVFANRPKGPSTDGPLKPAAVLGRPTTMVTARIRLDQLPESAKSYLLADFQRRNEASNARRPDEAEDAHDSRLAGVTLVSDGYKALLRDGRDATLSLDADPKGGALTLELAASARPSTPMAGSIQQFGASPSLFQGLGSKGMLHASARVPLADSFRKSLASVITRQREAAAKKPGDDDEKALAGEFFDIFEPIMTAPEFDLGLAGFGPFPPAKPGGPPTFAMLFGLNVRDGAKTDRLLRDLARKAAKEMPPGVESIKLDVARAGDGVTAVHEIRLKPNDDPALALYGEPVVRLAVKRDALLIGFGGNAPLIPALDAPVAPAATARATLANPPIQAVGSAGKLALFGLVAAKPAGMDRARDALQGDAAARDAIMIHLAGGNALTLRVKVDGGVMKLLEQVRQMRQGMPK